MRHCPFELAGETIAVEGVVGEGSGLFVEVVHGDERPFELDDAVHAPTEVGELVDKRGFEGRLRVVLLEEAFEVFFVDEEVVVAEDSGFGEERVLDGVHGGTVFAGGSFRSRGVL